MRGAFGQDQVLLSSASLLASVSGLCAIMLVRVLVQGFAARQDTKTPVRCSLTSIACNIVLNLILIKPLGYVGLALSTALAAYVNAFMLLYFLKKRDIYTITGSSAVFIVKTAIAGLAMALVLRFFGPSVEEWFAMTTVASVLNLALWITAGAVIYFVVSLALGIRPSILRR